MAETHFSGEMEVGGLMPNVNGGSPNGNSGRAHRDGQALAVGTQIRERREAQGTSLRALARECDMSPAHLSKIERGLSRPSLETLTVSCRGSTCTT